MISLAPGTKVFLACQPIDLRAGFNGLAAKVQPLIGQSPFDGSLFLFRGKRGDYFKAIYWDGTGLWLLAKRLG
jgi:transposase